MKAALAVLFLLASFTTASATPKSVTAALQEVSSHCSGYQKVSDFRPGARIAGSGRRSLHSYGLAIDFKVNDYRCAYSVLSGWGHGLSMDAWRVHHIHISDGSAIGRTEGRFFHGGGYRHYAHHRGHRRHYARA